MSAPESLLKTSGPLVRLTDVYKTFQAGTVNEVRPMRGINLTPILL